MDLRQTRVAVLVEQQYQEMEVWYPIFRLREAGCKVTLVGPEAGATYPSKLGYPAKSDKAAKDVTPDDFDDLALFAGVEESDVDDSLSAGESASILI